MKLYIIHLSDLHLKENFQINKYKIENIIKTLIPYKKDIGKLLFVVSGDIAQSGKAEEYNKFNKIKFYLLEFIKQHLCHYDFIDFFVVPGNHDKNYSEQDKEYDIEQEFFKNSNKNVLNIIEKNTLNNFFDFAGRNHCFKNNNYFMLDKKIISLNRFKIKVNLLNTAIFSKLSNDKGLHFFPDNILNRIPVSETEYGNDIKYSICVMHHHYEWFHDSMKNKLETSLIKGTSLLILGHEHTPKAKCTTIDNYKSLDIVYGGILFNDKIKGSFNLIIIDDLKENIEVIKYVESNEEIYTKSDTIQYKLIDKKINQNNLYPTDKFLKDFCNDDKNSISNNFTDYYVFPRLMIEESDPITKDKEKDVEIFNIETFKKVLENKRYITIKGKENFGKTTFLKFLYLNFLKNQIPIFISAKDLFSKKIDNFIEQAFYDQYGNDYQKYTRFLQTDNSNKIIFIDDADHIKESNLKVLLSKLRDMFGYIVLCIKDKVELDIFEKVISELDDNFKFDIYRLTNFYSDKRKALIDKIINVKFKDREDDEKKDLFSNTICENIRKQFEFLDINPNWIIKYTEYIINNGEIACSDKNVFNIIFDNNIINNLRKYTSDTNLQSYTYILENIAYFIHKEHRYPFTIADLNKIITDYNEDFDQKISPTKFLDVLRKTKILKLTADGMGYIFTDNNVFAYFLAKKINRKYNNDRNNSDLLDILNNICFGVNDNVILFLSYITQNKDILLKICDEAESYTSTWEEFSLNEKNIEYLSKYKRVLKISNPQPKSKDEIIELETESEKIKDEHKEIEITNLYDYNEDDLNLESNKLLKATKYLEIIARALPNFRYSLLVNEQKNFIKNIYSLPNKIIFRLLSQIDQNFDFVIDNIHSRLPVDKNVSRDKIIEVVFSVSIGIILSLYYATSKESVNKENVRVLSKYMDSDNFNNVIQNCMMQEEVSNIDELQKYIDILLKKDDIIIYNMVHLILSKCIIYNTNVESSVKRKLMDKYFKTDQRRRLLISQIKHDKEFKKC